MNATPDQTGTNSSTTHLQVLQISNSCDMLFLHSKLINGTVLHMP